MVLKHDEDLYRGNPPGTGLTTRMAISEDRQEKMSRNLNKLLWVCVGLVATVVAELIKNALFH